MTPINKLRIEVDEMFELFHERFPAHVPNRTNVGRFARTIGYKLAKQQVNKATVYFYAKRHQIPMTISHYMQGKNF